MSKVFKIQLIQNNHSEDNPYKHSGNKDVMTDIVVNLLNNYTDPQLYGDSVRSKGNLKLYVYINGIYDKKMSSSGVRPFLREWIEEMENDYTGEVDVYDLEQDERLHSGIRRIYGNRYKLTITKIKLGRDLHRTYNKVLNYDDMEYFISYIIHNYNMYSVYDRNGTFIN